MPERVVIVHQTKLSTLKTGTDIFNSMLSARQTWALANDSGVRYWHSKGYNYGCFL